MSYHIVSIDAPSGSLSCRDKQLVYKTENTSKSLPLEDIAAIVVTGFSISIHSKLLLEAGQRGISLIICENFKPASIILPANRTTDTLLTRAQLELTSAQQKRLWQKTVNAKTKNQFSLARFLAPQHLYLPKMKIIAEGEKLYKESICAGFFWKIYGTSVAKDSNFSRDRKKEGINALLNYGYTVLLSTVLQKCFALGLDPTFGIAHAVREHSTPLAYDLMEPFRPCIDWRISQWIKKHPTQEKWNINKEFRHWIVGILLEKVKYSDSTMEINNCIENVVRSFRKAILKKQTGIYQPWIQRNSKWAGS